MSEQTRPEWGERRRRREEERRHIPGEQSSAGAPAPSAAVPPVPPLSRRELRERAAAEAARSAAGFAGPSAQPAPQPAAQPGTPVAAPYVPVAPQQVRPSAPATPAVTPAPVATRPVAPEPPVAARPVPPEPPSRTLSRRELRERAAVARAQEPTAAASGNGPAAPSGSPFVRPTHASPSPGAPAPTPAAPTSAAPVAPVVVPRLEPERPATASPPPAALSPQARAAAIRAQAARAQAEREQAARLGIERAQSARGAAQRSATEPAPSMWTQRAQNGGQDADRSGAARAPGVVPGRAEQPDVASRPTPEPSAPVRRVALPASAGQPAEGSQASAVHGFGGAQPAGYPPAPAQPSMRRYQPQTGPSDVPAAAYGQQPGGRPFVAPVIVPPAVGAVTTTPEATTPRMAPGQAFEPVGLGGRDRVGAADSPPRAFVPAGIPVAGQSLGTMQAASMGSPVAGHVVGAPTLAGAGPAAGDGVAEDRDGASVPRWGSVAPGQGWTPAQTSTRGEPAPEDDEEPDESITELPRHPYTWLHMIVLVLVAFVLGMLIFVVLLEDSEPVGTQGAGATATMGDVVAWSRAAAQTAGAVL